MSKHTPGPWITKHRKGSDSMYRTEVFSEEHGGIATCEWTPKHCGNGVTETYREANAQLIAAAPDMLAALNFLHQCSAPMTSQQEECWKLVRAAIAKATGELFNVRANLETAE